jgi:hypothetical protein
MLMIFFYNQVAYYLVYSIMKYGEKEKIEQHILSTLPESECVIINITANADRIHWEEAGEVFILNGVMYDITKKKKSGGNIYAYCITEEKEMEMLADCSLKFNSTGDGTAILNLAFSAEYMLQHNKSNIKTPPACSLPVSSVYTTPLTQRSNDILLPPPRATVS